jgi:hypothetical protein
MLIPVLMALTLVPGQEGALTIENARATYGFLGAARPADGIVAGDTAFFAFDLKNMKLDAAGKASYSLTVEVIDSQGKSYFKQGPTNATALSFLGGNVLPCSAQLEVPLHTPPGVYSLRVTVHDRAADKTVVLDRKGKVLPADFGLIHVGTFADRETKVPKAPVGIVGESLYISFAAVGFARDKSSRQPDLQLSLRVLDEQGKPTMSAPLSGRANQDIAEELKILPMQFALTLNRVGRFTVDLTATDQLTRKTARVTFPIRVVTLD